MPGVGNLPEASFHRFPLWSYLQIVLPSRAGIRVGVPRQGLWVLLCACPQPLNFIVTSVPFLSLGPAAICLGDKLDSLSQDVAGWLVTSSVLSVWVGVRVGSPGAAWDCGETGGLLEPQVWPSYPVSTRVHGIANGWQFNAALSPWGFSLGMRPSLNYFMGWWL